MRHRNGRALFLSMALVPALGGGAEGRSCRVNLVPHGQKFGCATCHVSAGGGGTRNAFGRSLTQIVGTGCGAFWSAQLAAADADGDGITNGAELQDPEGAWRSGMRSPGDPALVTNPGVRDAAPSPRFLRGDSNTDGAVHLSDAIQTLVRLFSGTAPSPCRDAEDVNADGIVNISDAIHTLEYLFTGAGPPAAPFPLCGLPAPGTRLGCQAHLPCD